MERILIIRDDSCLFDVLHKMRGNIRLSSGCTEEDDMEEYKKQKHINYFTESGGFLCVSVHDKLVVVWYAWYDKTFKARKEMVQLGRELYEFYTTKLNRPIYYTGLKNFYSHHSVEVGENIYIFKP